ncbi:MAG: DUF1028 domain-containing protein [Thermoflexales bacterium]|nr:DUF1028 domain-containing protein [Thermoflexales bacterium]
MRIATFSIVACDTSTHSWGVAVASKFLAVGAYVPYAQAAAGAVATQALANLSYGPDALARLAAGESAEQVVAALTAADPGHEERQLGIVDAQGRAATFTGRKCMDWAGGITGPSYAAQGNLLAGPEVVLAMGEAFSATRGDLASRLLAALAAGDAVGGDRRGRQGSALYVVRPAGGYGGFNDVVVDLRVDDHPHPVTELQRLLGLHRLYFGATPAAEKLVIDRALTRELQALARAAGTYLGDIDGEWDDDTRDALRALTGAENLEERIDLTHATIDPPALEALRERFGP